METKCLENELMDRNDSMHKNTQENVDSIPPLSPCSNPFIIQENTISEQPEVIHSTPVNHSKSSNNVLLSLICCFGVFSIPNVIVNFQTYFTSAGMFTVQISRCVLYATDVVTDLLTGWYFVNGTVIDQERFHNKSYSNYTNLICSEFELYSHPIWGSMVFIFSWAPAIALVPPLFASVYDKTKIEGNLSPAQLGVYVEPYWKTIFILSLLVIVWPLTGIVMYDLRYYADTNF